MPARPSLPARPWASPRRTAHLGALLIGLLGVAGALQAQQVYRIVGPDGRVTFSDRPPEKAPAAPTVQRGAAAADASSGLPAELRKTANQYPVTLYATRDCSACDAARRLLQGRGIPYTEKTVDTEADNEAFKRLTGSDSLPALGIGNQTLKGLLDSEWNSYLDAAGYPGQIQLPASYRRPPPTPLAPPTPSPAPATKDKPAAGKPAPALPVVPQRATENNPAGLQF